MDRRSWLWRRKSSEKSLGETESSGSISSHSERFSDDQACAIHSSLSPEITSKALNTDDEVTANVKTLTLKLSAALLNIKEKEEILKQHAKVAEEAVSGWENSEKETSALKQQLEAAARKNSALEDRVSHLDGALKECVRQLRQAREEKQQKIQEAIIKNSQDFENEKSEFENQIADLQAELESAEKKANDSVHDDLRSKLEALEKENSALKIQLVSRSEELEIMIIERDLSTQAAETASKQHLQSIKKLTKLEAECRRLKAMARKPPSSNDLKPYNASSPNYVEPFTQRQSDSSERLIVAENEIRRMQSLKMNECEPSPPEKVTGKTLMGSSVEIDFMDDFLEMERIASLPASQVRSGYLATSKVSEKSNACELQLKKELESLLNRITELEEKVEMAEVEKLQLEMALTGSKKQIETLQNQLSEKEGNLSGLKKVENVKLELERALAESQKQLQELQNQLNKGGKLSELEKIRSEKLKLAICLTGTKKQLETSQNKLKELEGKLKKLKDQLSFAIDAKETAEKEVKAVNMKSEATESRLRHVEEEVRTLLSKIASLEKDANKEGALSAERLAECKELQAELSKLKDECINGFNGDSKMKQEKELAVAAGKFAECQRTIASLGQQLKCLATLEDFLLDSQEPLNLNPQDFDCPTNCRNQQNLNTGELNLSKRNSESLNMVRDYSNSIENASDGGLLFPLTPAVSSERSQNAFGKFLSRNESGRRN